MKVGDLVRPSRERAWLQKEEWNVTGIVVQVLDGGSHRKNTSYEVLWSHKSDVLSKWHTDHSLELVK